VWNRYKVKKHFEVNITDDTLTYERKQEQIAQEAELLSAVEFGHARCRWRRSS